VPLFTLLAAWLPAPEAGAGETPRAQTLVITATRVPTPAGEVANTITVIDGEEIERRQLRSVGDALQGVSSLSVIRDGGPGKSISVFSRGTEANHTLVLIDGVEMNDPSTPDGRFDFSDLLIDNVERIEVLHGPQSGLYGSDAIGAVINIVTRKGEGAPTVSAAVEGGSFKTLSQYTRFSGGTDLYNYAFNFQHLSTEGITALQEPRFSSAGRSDRDAYENYTATTRLGLTPFEWIDLNASARYIRTRNELDLNSTTVADDADSRARSEKLYVNGEMRLRPIGHWTEHRFAVTRTDITRRNLDDQDSVNTADFLRSRNEGYKEKLELQNDLHWMPGQTLTVGIESERESIVTKHSSLSAWGFFNQAAEEDVRTKSLYIQEQFALFSRLFGSLGLRIDDNESFGTAHTYRTAAAYLHPETGTKIKGSYATGFKAPALFELFGTSVSAFSAFRGNPDLQPERSHGWEVGFEQMLLDDLLNFGLTYYENNINNLIAFTSDFSSNENIGAAKTRGYEAFVSAEVTDNVTAAVNYAYTRAEDVAKNEDLLRRPIHKFSGNLTWKARDDLTLVVEATHVGKRWDTDAALGGRIRRGGYTVANLKGRYRIDENFELFGRIENALARRYLEPDGFEQPGRAGYLGVKATY
jgi:vitamin B12 transporter